MAAPTSEMKLDMDLGETSHHACARFKSCFLPSARRPRRRARRAAGHGHGCAGRLADALGPLRAVRICRVVTFWQRPSP
ncbi:MAG: hypothetical protein ACPIOQ_24630 [Promethearchaeia archaeon]